MNFDVTKPSARDRLFQLVLVTIAMALAPIGVIISTIGAVSVASDGKNPGGAIFFAVMCLLAGVFAVARFRSLRSGRYGKNPDDSE
ncbi:putative membrane protein [Cryobacterium sp. CAN_C3]|uniref:hypothetical protein n=1 Tax=unclassified Cryobacterium TaxID=2649013 RepID=UPI0018C956C3|nr:hypothetical protein [Cryobacterium sp. CAN_C3]MEC5155763.1 putative membrane protein [Cryobacterium sp. CAN_C3]